METIYNILLISTSAIGLYVSIVLFFFSKHNRLLNRLLAVFTLAITMTYTLVLISKTQWGIDVVALIRTFAPIYLIAYPPCYLYVRTFLQDDVSLSRKDLVHAIPFLLNFVYVTPLLLDLTTGHVQWKELIGQVNDPTYFINYGPIPDVYHVVFRSAIGIMYTVLSLKLFLGKKFHAFEALNKETYPLAIIWIKYFVVIIACHSLFSILTKTQVFFFHKPGIVYDGNWMSIGILLTFNILFAYASFNPVILFGLPHFTRYLNPSEPFPQKVLHPQSFGILRIAQPTPETAGTATAPVRYEVSVAEPVTEPIDLLKKEEAMPLIEQAETTIEETEAILQLIERMERYMAEKQPFRQKEFNTFTISRDLDVPQHHIAYLFKYILKKSVVDYRNKWRVNYVIDCLKHGRHNQYTIETIGLDAGYNSKSTFFLDFKKHTGKTPLQYVEEMGEG